MSYPTTRSLPQRHLHPEHHPTLEKLAAAGLRGCAGPILLGQGFRVGMLVDLVGEGLATARREPMKVGTRTITIVHIRITGAGRQAIMAERRSVRRPPVVR